CCRTILPVVVGSPPLSGCARPDLPLLGRPAPTESVVG
ncbi:MAG: hypothetical protein AVDCRST_MAG34-3111, partial [uncultured Nocardioidaceae bacterium]